MTVRKLWLKAQIVPMYLMGKDLEIRIKNDYTKLFEVGDTIIFNEGFRRTIVAIRGYNNFGEMLDTEAPERIAPGKNKDQVKKLIYKFFKQSADRRGVLVFELKSP